MSKHIHFLVACKLLFIDYYRDVSTLVVIIFNVIFDTIDFLFVHDCEKTEKDKFTKQFFKLFCIEMKKRKLCDSEKKIKI